ncbi:hypothetical protein OEA41_005261 [Lepraria neglecta]|uniref:Uncharacterized protein n=1 Tax=Lepraria neglecta TaxID=209136 RepID=A0AAD9Z1H5_9LECA|nr:hypothetical protein OEA41_005261 [Lepraria neglecta]
MILPLVASDSRDVTLFFDTAGTGKTTVIQDKIRKVFGFYCVAPNLLPSDKRDMSSVIAPDRACASRDTYSFYEDFKALAKLDIDSRAWQDFLTPRSSRHYAASMNSTPIIAARHRLLEIFKEIEGRRVSNAEESQVKWLQLQISCWPGNDPFDAAYRFIRLKSEVDLNTKMGALSQGKLWAFDEAQQVLCDPLASELMADIMWNWDIKFRNTQGLLSGTSLEFQQMQKFLKKEFSVALNQQETVFGRKYQNAYVLNEDKFLETMCVHAWNIVKELYALQSCNNSERGPKDFPLLSRGGRALGFTIQLPRGTWEEVEMVLQKWYIFDVLAATTTTTTMTTDSLSSFMTSTKTATDTSDTSKKTTKTTVDPPSLSTKPSRELTKFLSQVKRVHSVLLGRIRWTTLFAEELLRASPATQGKLTDQDVNNAIERATNTIKRSLRERIDRFKHTHWVYELYWTAIEADVFSMTRIFSDEESAKLISEGFALVDEEWKRSIK